MTNEAQRIAIAEAYGISVIKAKNGGYFTVLRKTKHIPDGYEDGSFIFEDGALATIPNYLNDLNAMHEAIMAQTPEVRMSINAALMEPLKDAPYCLDKTINATAAQRAEALLRTLGRWKPDEAAIRTN